MKRRGYAEGCRAGKADRFIGIKSEYTWWSFLSESAYTRNYSRGYRDGWADRSVDLEDTSH